MNLAERTRLLRTLVMAPTPLMVPGIHDGLSARLVQASGFEVAFVSGAGVSMSRLGQADLAFLNLSDLCDGVRAMALACTLPLIVDIDTGFGNAHNAGQAVRQLERAGASALQMEDQTFPKRCGHLAGKSVIPAVDMVSKIHAACEARANPETMIIARTDALAVMGLQDALARCDLYLAAGADALFVEAPRSIGEMKAIAHHIAGRAPLVHNFVEGGKSPIANMQELGALGYQIGLFPLVSLHAAVPAQLSILSHLRETGQSANWFGPMADLKALNSLVGLPEQLAKTENYGSDET
jgi:2-methylisocitrate lyase-like PEP mutase family enzyme